MAAMWPTRLLWSYWQLGIERGLKVLLVARAFSQRNGFNWQYAIAGRSDLTASQHPFHSWSNLSYDAEDIFSTHSFVKLVMEHRSKKGIWTTYSKSTVAYPRLGQNKTWNQEYCLLTLFWLLVLFGTSEHLIEQEAIKDCSAIKIYTNRS